MQSNDDIPNTDIGFWLEYYVEVNERSETHCVEIYFLNLQSSLLNIAIIFANHPFSTKLDTQQQTTKHLLFDNAAALSLSYPGFPHLNPPSNYLPREHWIWKGISFFFSSAQG